MSKPKRWLDDPEVPDRIRTLLEAARPAPPLTAAIDARLHEAASAPAALLTKLPLALSGKLLAGALVVGVAGTWAAGALLPSAPSLPPAPAASKRTPAEPAHELSREPNRLRGSRGSTSTESSTGVVSADPMPRTATNAEAGSARDERGENAVVAPPRSIGDEAALLDRARRALTTDSAFALALTERHQREYAEPSLAAEREVIAVEALLQLGRRSEAERRAQALMDTAPAGIYGKRLRRLLSRQLD